MLPKKSVRDQIGEKPKTESKTLPGIKSSRTYVRVLWRLAYNEGHVARGRQPPLIEKAHCAVMRTLSARIGRGRAPLLQIYTLPVTVARTGMDSMVSIVLPSNVKSPPTNTRDVRVISVIDGLSLIVRYKPTRVNFGA